MYSEQIGFRKCLPGILLLTRDHSTLHCPDAFLDKNTLALYSRDTTLIFHRTVYTVQHNTLKDSRTIHFLGGGFLALIARKMMFTVGKYR